VGVNRDTEPYHSVFLEDRVLKTRHKLLLPSRPGSTVSLGIPITRLTNSAFDEGYFIRIKSPR
jgi:hypothetical protein